MKPIYLATSFAVSALFLSCGDIVTTHGCAMAAKQSSKIYESYEELDQICEIGERKRVIIYDFSSKEIDWDYVCSHAPGYVLGSGRASEEARASSSGVYYIVNGVNMTQEEYDVYIAEYWRKYYEENAKSGRDLQIPCSLGDGTAWLTDEEIAELKEKYEDLAIEEYREPVPGHPGSETGETDHGC